MMQKKCKKCFKLKDISCFYSRRITCKTCICSQQKGYRNKYPDKVRECHRKHYKKNRERILLEQKMRFLRSPDECRRRRNAYYRSEAQKEKTRKRYARRIKTCIDYKIKKNLRTRIYLAIKGLNKSQTTVNMLGCSIEKFMRHLELQFQDGMTWENYGQWHVDHIKPCASFDFSIPEEQKRCFHYTNLQPLWEKDNLRKHSKIV